MYANKNFRRSVEERGEREREKKRDRERERENERERAYRRSFLLLWKFLAS
jgi:hypothetical protein